MLSLEVTKRQPLAEIAQRAESGCWEEISFLDSYHSGKEIAQILALPPLAQATSLRFHKMSKVDLGDLKASLSRFKKVVLCESRLLPEDLRVLLGSCGEALSFLSLRACDIGPTGAQELARSPSLQNLDALDLYGDQIKSEGTKALVASSYLKRLTSLSLDGALIGAAGLKALVRSGLCPRLKDLSLGYNKLTDVSLETLSKASFPALTRLDLPGNQIGSRGLKALSGMALDNLIELNLRYNNVLEEVAAALALASASLPCLSRLDLGRLSREENPAGNEVAQVLSGASWAKQLGQFSLYNNQVGAKGAEALLRAMPSLKVLDISRNDLGDAGLEALAKRGLKLSSLDISSDCFTAAGVRSLAAASTSQELRHLNLRFNHEFAAEGVEAIATSPHLSRLLSLDLSHCEIGPNGARALARSPYLRSLESLNLDWNYLCDFRRGDLGGVEELVASPVVSSVRVLNLQQNDIFAKTIKAIAASPMLQNLRSLDLGWNDFDVADLVGSKTLLHLEELIVRRNYEMSKGGAPEAKVRRLVQSWSLSSVRRLDLSDCWLDDAAVMNLISPALSNLETLNLKENKGLKEATKDQLRTSPYFQKTHVLF
jgi:Leucine-rich repeat (LRR) protein